MYTPTAFAYDDWKTQYCGDWGYGIEKKKISKHKCCAKKKYGPSSISFSYTPAAATNQCYVVNAQWYGSNVGTTANSDIWTVWNQQVNVTGAQTAQTVVNWMQQPSGSITMGSNSVTVQYPETDEQRIERERRYEEMKAKEDAATKRAEEMLFLILSDKQRKQYEDHGYFETTVNDRLYRINKGRSMNVELIEGGVPKFKYCALPRSYMPAPDVMAAQLLMLQTDEQRFLEIANRTVLHHVPTDAQPNVLTAPYSADGQSATITFNV